MIITSNILYENKMAVCNSQYKKFPFNKNWHLKFGWLKNFYNIKIKWINILIMRSKYYFSVRLNLPFSTEIMINLKYFYLLFFNTFYALKFSLSEVMFNVCPNALNGLKFELFADHFINIFLLKKKR